MRIVLVEPEIHFNTGNVGRTCVATGSELHLVQPLGFSLDEAEVRRAGLDYWPKVRLTVHKSLSAFLHVLPVEADLKLFSKEGKKVYWDAKFGEDDWLIFGKESVGLPAALREEYKDRLYRIPISDDVRSLNLSTSAGVVIYEGLRQLKAR